MRRRKKHSQINICPFCQRGMSSNLDKCPACGTTIPQDATRSVRFPGVKDEKTNIATIVGPNDYMRERYIK